MRVHLVTSSGKYLVLKGVVCCALAAHNSWPDIANGVVRYLVTSGLTESSL